MSRYCWNGGKWFSCQPSSKLKYDSGSDSDEENKNKTKHYLQLLRQRTKVRKQHKNFYRKIVH